MDNLITQFHTAVSTLNKLSQYEDQVKNNADKQIRDINGDYRGKIYDLERERDGKTYEIGTQRDSEINTIKEQSKPHAEITERVNRLFRFMHLSIEGLDVPTPDVHYYNNSMDASNKRVQVDPIATLREDKYNKIYLYILPNKKPTNRFTLKIVGYTPLNNEHNWKGEQDVKDAPTQEALVEYAKKNLDKIKSLLPSNFEELATEYEFAVELLKDKDWWILYLASRKNYYAEHYSGGTTTPEYKDLCAIYAQYKKNPKDMILLLGQLKSEEGKQILEKLLKG
jgi:hypothetical protein